MAKLSPVVEKDDREQTGERSSSGVAATQLLTTSVWTLRYCFSNVRPLITADVLLRHKQLPQQLSDCASAAAAAAAASAAQNIDGVYSQRPRLAYYAPRPRPNSSAGRRNMQKIGPQANPQIRSTFRRLLLQL